MDCRTIIVFDRDDARRAAIYRTLAPAVAVIPVASLADLGSSWPASAWFLVHDDAELLGALNRAFASKGLFHPIIAYSETLLPSRVVEAIYGGAVNYMQWPCEAPAVLEAIRSVSAIAIRRCEHAAARSAICDRLSALSPRELDVARCIGKGMTSKEIGRSLGISHRTVEIHRANALIKIGARNTAEAARLLADADEAATGLAAVA